MDHLNNQTLKHPNKLFVCLCAYMFMSKISIIIPVYNHASALQKALDSIAMQTYKDFEVIVVDDGSDEEIGKLGNKEISKFRNFPISLFREPHAGAPAARNFGFIKSKGEFVIFWDADVVGKPDMLEKMLKTLQNNPEASYAYSDFYFGFKKMPAGPFDGERLKKMNYIMTTSLIRREAFPGFDESLRRFQDWDLWLTMLKQGKKGIYIPEILFTVTPHKGGMSHWLPSFTYKKPWRWLPGIRARVDGYEATRQLVLDKFSEI